MINSKKLPKSSYIYIYIVSILLLLVFGLFTTSVWGKYAQDLSATTELKVTISDYTINKTKMQTVIKSLSTKPTSIKYVTGSSVPTGLTNLATTSVNGASTAGIQEDDGSMIGVFQDGTTLYIAPMNAPAESDSTGAAATAANNNYVMYTPVDASTFLDLTTMGYTDYTYDSITELDLSNLDTSKTTDMSRMFFLCRGVTSIDVSKFDTSKVTNMSDMFYYMAGLTELDVSNFDTSKVTNMSFMFQRCENLTTLKGLTNFNTEHVTNMQSMFARANNIPKLDLSAFNTGQVTTMYNMFYACNKLAEITLGENFDFKGTDGYLPTPSSGYITGADGNWYDTETNIGYTSTDQASYHNDLSKKRTYTAVPPTNYYWLAAAGASDPSATSGILKKQSEVDEDMKVLHGTLDKTSAGKDKAAVTAEWEGYMNGNTHLYTRWYGSDAGTGANQWVELRIIQVGEHDGDGSAVTFMATHGLPTAKPISNDGSNAGGWAASQMRNTTMIDYVAAGMKDIASSVLTVNKIATSGNYDDDWTEGSVTSDKFWLLSNSEVYGTGDNNSFIGEGYCYEEGTQYVWFAEQGVNAKNGYSSSNSIIEDIYRTRSFTEEPINLYYVGCWLRSPEIDVDDCFGFISVYGSQGNDSTNLEYSVVPAFAF